MFKGRQVDQSVALLCVRYSKRFDRRCWNRISNNSQVVRPLTAVLRMLVDPRHRR
jgi:hypothetical protein